MAELPEEERRTIIKDAKVMWWITTIGFFAYMFLMGVIGEIPSSPWWAWVLKIILGIIITIPVFRYAQGAVQQAVVYKSFTHNHRYDTALGGEIFTAMHDDYPLTITRTGAGRYQLDRPDWKAPKTLQANPDL